MTLYTRENALVLWHDVIKNAQNRCEITLQEDLEAYLISLLIRYTDKPEIVRQVFATAFLESLQKRAKERDISLQNVGDHCLLFAGLFPHTVEKRQVKLSYFVELGRTAYATVSAKTHDGLYGSLAVKFVVLMDVLQSIPDDSQMLPLEAYQQWEELGSQRAYKILQEYTDGMPLFKPKE